MSPVDDTFLSGSLDKTIRLWDLRSPNCQVPETAILNVLHLVHLIYLFVMALYSNVHCNLVITLMMGAKRKEHYNEIGLPV